MTENNVVVPRTGYEFYDDPLFISGNDQSSQLLVQPAFSGLNFLQWKRDVYLALVSKNKEGFIDGSCKKPNNTEKTYHQWIRCDIMVMKWILNSMDLNLRESLSYVSTAKELWTEILDRYGQSNALEVYELRKDLSTLSQKNASVVEYYSAMKRN